MKKNTLARARNDIHLAVLEAIFIASYQPVLCSQKDHVRCLTLFGFEFACCPGLSTSPVPVLSLSSTNFVSIVTLSPCTTSDEQWSEKLY